MRVMNQLCNRLLANGYNAAIVTEPKERPPFRVRYLTPNRLAKQKQKGRVPIVVYPEVVKGNPLNARFVVRYLLNKPGLLVPGSELLFGASDYFITADPKLVPEGRSGHDLFMPMVDRSIYYPPPRDSVRSGFVVFSNRAVTDAATFPPWLTPIMIVSMRQPRSHAELADLYRSSRAIVVWERSSAIHEALSCGCPVICIGNESFNKATYQPRFRGCGLIWGWRQQQIEMAGRRTRRYRRIYRRLERNLDRRVRAVFDAIIEDAMRRSLAEPALPPGSRRNRRMSARRAIQAPPLATGK
jgi:hypothetical protein